MRKTHHIAGASSKIREGRFHGGTQRRSFYADLSPVVGSEQGGVRPVLIVQNEIGNRHSPTVIAAAITSRLDKARLPPTSISGQRIRPCQGQRVLLEQIRTLDKHRLRERAGQITPEDQKRVDQALDVSLGLTSY